MRKLFIVLALASLSFAGTYNEKTKVWTPAKNENQFGMSNCNYNKIATGNKADIDKLNDDVGFPIHCKLDDNAPASPHFLQNAQKKGYILKKSNGKYFSWRDIKNASLHTK